MAQFDQTLKIAPFLDRHLVFPLLEFLQDKGIYPNDQILKAKIELLAKTNMVDYMMDIHRSLYDEVPKEMMDRRAEVVNRLKALEDLAAPLIAFLQNPQMTAELKPERQANLQMLHDRYQIGPEHIDALYQYAKFQFECGNYSGAADFLYQYRTLTINSEKAYSAMWGKFAAEILMQNWSGAEYELGKLKEAMDSKNFSSPLVQVQNRVWLMHWSLFVYFNLESGRHSLIDLFMNDRYLHVIQTHAHHLLRYLAAAFVVCKRKHRGNIKDFIKVIQQEHHTYRDPITEFLECLYVNYDFEGAQRKLQECEDLILNDFFLGRPETDNGYIVYKFRDEFLENARLAMFETYCKIHQRIDIGMLSDKLHMNYDDAERWIANLINFSRLDAKIDSKNGTVVMGVQHTDVYEQAIERTKPLATRTYVLARNIAENLPVRA
ncbi:hypothetical protein SELMODRAFT_269977 [Selaginella moellendorffii]|uniref:Eukaryotic translation initiation factor 3 subunit E n=1 Tax=Selaginella moellendorffii TaxID=88036 RepID=D8TAX5_SELML|nr:eukaryotic translation initiation factor 3 subunit E [Selaginella moellendorffii]XP_024522983.1 eukaryotic translation initiation factor 3 subunit E [Selaginella moellendorffii]EFJ05347.1 hypothetical protein SELMODRAFT_272327 [Selaginella moellendorffii]EFJ06230.1 hypothetical protein SELMODRAFT_269977 [Selaginella moellendorffii]|eukprot:XP_024522123.1 eukaryotic translation initiation factor 3 subunit E [Selaginella moellendorffii]